jgi:hypothetical protein
MTKRFALLFALLVTAVALLGATGCTKKKMMGALERPNSVTHAVS